MVCMTISSVPTQQYAALSLAARPYVFLPCSLAALVVLFCKTRRPFVMQL